MSKMQAMEPDGLRARLSDEDDVEGHSVRAAIEPDGIAAARLSDEDDVEGHVGRIGSAKSRGE